MTESVRDQILERDDYVCQYCGVDYSDDPTSLNLVSTEPISETSGRSLENLETRCDSCAKRREMSDPFLGDETEPRLISLLDALEFAQTKQMFGNDGLRIITIAIAIPPILFTAMGIGIESHNVQNLRLVSNIFIVGGFFAWIGTMLVAVLAYYYSRISGSNPSVIERLFEIDESKISDEESTLTAQAEKSYRRNAKLIATSIVFLAITVLLFTLGYLDLLDINIVLY